MQPLLSKKMLVTVVLVTLLGATFACQGLHRGSPAPVVGPAEQQEIVIDERKPVLVIWPAIVSKKEGEVTIFASSFIPGDAIWIDISSADKEGLNVPITEEQVQVNEQGTFSITVECKKALKDVNVKKRGVFVVKAYSGKQRAIIAPIVITE